MSRRGDALEELQKIFGVGPATAEKLYDGGYEDTGSVAAAGANELSEDCGISYGKAEAIISAANDLSEDNDEHIEHGDSDNSVLSDMRKDLHLKLTIASGRQNIMKQEIGIIMAFASILLIQLVYILLDIDTDAVLTAPAICFIISALSVFACCIIGLVTILRWSFFTLEIGMSINKMTELYNESEISKLETDMLNGLIDSIYKTYANNSALRVVIIGIVILLIIGVIFLVTGCWTSWV